MHQTTKLFGLRCAVDGLYAVSFAGYSQLPFETYLSRKIDYDLGENRIQETKTFAKHARSYILVAVKPLIHFFEGNILKPKDLGSIVIGNHDPIHIAYARLKARKVSSRVENRSGEHSTYLYFRKAERMRS